MPRKHNLFSLIGVLSLIASLWLLQLKFDLTTGRFSPVAVAAAVSVLIFLLYLVKPVRQELAIRAMYRRILHRVKSHRGKNPDEDENSGRNRFISAFETLKAEGRDLRDYPVLVVIGDGPDEVQALVASANLTPVQGETPLEPINSRIDGHSFRWWIAREAILIDLSPSLGTPDSDLPADWAGITPLLRQLDDKPVDGVLVVMPADRIGSDEEHKAKQAALRLRTRLNAIAKPLTRQAPVYLFINQAETIEGFTEYVKYCAGPSSTDAIGFTDAGSRYADSYNQMLSQLYRRLPACFAAVPTKKEKLRLNGFPHLLSTLFNPLYELSSAIVNDKTSLRFSGLYFTSAQDEHPYAEAALKQVIRAQRKRLVPVESQQARALKVGVLTVGLLAFAAWAFVLFDTYRANKALFAKKAAELAKFSKIRRPSPYNFNQVLTYLAGVRALKYVAMPKSKTGLPRIEMPLAGRIRRHLAGYYHQEVNRLLPAALAHFFERYITTNEIRGIAAFKALSAYMALKRFKHRDRRKVLKYLLSHTRLRKDSPAYRALIRHYRVLDPAQVRKQVKLNYIIVNELQSKVDDKLLLKLLDRAIVKKLSGMKQPPVRFSSLFEQPVRPYLENINAPEVPYLYTAAGYAKYITAIDIALQQLRRASWVLQKGGLPEKRLYTLKKQLLSGYITKYVAFWRAAVDGLRIKPLRNREHAMVFLNTVRRYPDFFGIFSDFALKHLSVITLKTHSSALIEQLRRLKARSRLVDRSTRLYSALKENDKAGLVHQINELKAAGEDDTGGSSPFFTHLAQQLNRALFDDERSIMASAYQDKVLSLCRTVAARYPFREKAKKTSRLGQFHTLFASNGRIEKFFSDYLQKYFTSDMKLNEEGKGLGINPKVVSLLQTARKIRKNLFYKNRLRVRYKLKPKLLDSRANQILVEVGRKKFNYRHGAQLIENVSWPPSGKKKRIRFAFYLPGQGVVEGRVRSTDWTFFRMIDRAVKKRASVVFKSGSYQAEYSAYIVDRRKYRHFKQLARSFRCPALFTKPLKKAKKTKKTGK